MRLVVEHHEVGHFTDDQAEVYLRVGGLPGRTRAQEVVGHVRIIEAGRVLPLEDAMYVAEKDVAGIRYETDLILDVHGELKVVLPVLALVAVGRQDRVLVENLEAVEVHPQPLEHDDVRGYEQEVGG